MDKMLRVAVLLTLLESGRAAVSFDSDDLQEFILDFHNEKRALVASGKVKGYPKAANMNVLRWDEALAAAARSWAEQCDYAHEGDFRCGVGDYHALGENLAVHTTPRPLGRLNATHLKDMVTWALDFMYEEHRNWRFGAYPGKCRRGICGHFTQMLWAETDAIGCGLVECKKVKHFSRARGRPTLLFVCKYGPAGNVPGLLPYNRGKPCSNCGPERSGCVRGSLCGPRRKKYACRDSPQSCSRRQDWWSSPCWDCQRWKRQGNCDPCKPTFKWSQQNCRKTCKLCGYDYTLNNHSGTKAKG